MSKYEPLRKHLISVGLRNVRMTFSEIESVLGFKLPKSASVYSAWWANERHGTHSHARSWLDAGYETGDLDLGARRVSFHSSGARGR